jgi:hypothetical protein
MADVRPARDTVQSRFEVFEVPFQPGMPTPQNPMIRG